MNQREMKQNKYLIRTNTKTEQKQNEKVETKTTNESKDMKTENETEKGKDVTREALRSIKFFPS